MACAQPWATARGPGDAPNPLTPASDAAGVAHALPAQRKATTDSMHATLRAQPTTACAPSSKAPPQHRQCRRYTHVGQQRSCIAQGLPAAQRQTARPSDARSAPRGAKPTSPHTPTIDRTHTPPSRRIPAAARLDGPCCRGPPTQGRWSGQVPSTGWRGSQSLPVQHTHAPIRTRHCLGRNRQWQKVTTAVQQPIGAPANTGCVAGKPPPHRRNCGAKLADNMRPLDAALPCFPVVACPFLPLPPPRWHTSVRWVSGRPPRWWSAA